MQKYFVLCNDRSDDIVTVAIFVPGQGGSRFAGADISDYRPGDDIVASIGHLPTDQDALALLDTLQQQFPGSLIHLLIGFGDVVVSRKRDPGGEQRAGGADQGAAKSTDVSAERGSKTRPASPESRKQGNIVELRYCFGNRIVAVSVPPQS